jgi:regulatory protein
VPMPRRLPTATALQWITTRYLQQRFTSAAHLRALLLARFRRADAYDPADTAAYEALVDAEIARLTAVGALDDARFAEARAQALRRRGASGRRIRATLRAKGVQAELVEDALRDPGAEHDPELTAARTWARKRHLGPWRSGPADPERRAKEIGRLVRNGFDYGTARRVVDEPPPEGEGPE